MSTTGGYTHAKAKARKPAPFKIGKHFVGNCIVTTDGPRQVWIDEFLTLNAAQATRFAAWMTAASKWCAEGGRR